MQLEKDVMMIRLATVFSGIGAVEHALDRLKIPHVIVFACDNGERKLKTSYASITKETVNMTNAERDAYVSKLYEKECGTNYVEQEYKANYKIAEDRYFQDVKLLNGTEFRGEVDLFVGGSPCQSFSNYGKKLGLEDVRGTLFYDYARIIQESKPKIFIYENVVSALEFLHIKLAGNNRNVSQNKLIKAISHNVSCFVFAVNIFY